MVLPEGMVYLASPFGVISRLSGLRNDDAHDGQKDDRGLETANLQNAKAEQDCLTARMSEK